MSRMQKLGTVATSVFTEEETVNVVYHSTAVVKFNQDKITLNHGGWKTYTTKTRMNQASNQFGLGYSVFQKNNEWFVDYKNETIPFNDKELILNR